MSNISDKVNLKSSNIGFSLNYDIGLIQNSSFGIKGGFHFEAIPFSFSVKIEKENFGFSDNIGFTDINYNYAPGLSLNSFFMKSVTPKASVKFEIGFNYKYFLLDGVYRGFSYGELIENRDITILETKIHTKTIIEKGFLNYIASIGIIRNLKNNNKYFFIELVGNLSHENITEGTIDFFVGEPYEENGIYIQKGHYIGLNTGFIFLGNK